MLDREKQPTGLMHSGEQLRKLLLEYPELPLVVFAKDSANSGDYYAMSCTDISAEVGEFLDCQQEYNDCYCFTDRDEFRDEIAETVYLDQEITDEQLERETERIFAEYEPYWKPCIILTVGN